jgi:RNA polymerase sigma factor (sigma-70 family)
MEPDLSQTLAPALEDIIWSLPDAQLQAGEPATRALVAAAGCNLATILEEMSDETLAMAVQKDFLRKAAFEEWLVNRYEKALLRWFYWRTGDWDLSQDLTQDLYVKLLTKSTLAAYHPDCQFRPWLWTVVHHLWVSEWRRRQKERSIPDLERPSNGPSPQEEAAARELETRVEAIVQQLPEPRQRVLRGAMTGASADQIAQELGLPKQRVFRELFKARRFVERALGQEPSGKTCRKEAPFVRGIPLEGSSP